MEQSFLFTFNIFLVKMIKASLSIRLYIKYNITALFQVLLIVSLDAAVSNFIQHLSGIKWYTHLFTKISKDLDIVYP
jgi:hypothetical protein